MNTLDQDKKVFLMSFDDFKEHFQCMTKIHLIFGWKYTCEKIKFDSYFQELNLVVAQEGDAYIMLNQQDPLLFD